jgi:hypothetical protein
MARSCSISWAMTVGEKETPRDLHVTMRHNAPEVSSGNILPHRGKGGT